MESNFNYPIYSLYGRLWPCIVLAALLIIYISFLFLNPTILTLENV
jgi:hypothetical protein